MRNVTITLILLLLSGCRFLENPLPLPEEIRNDFNEICGPIAPVDSGFSKVTPYVDVYLDRSLSMRGYIRVPSTRAVGGTDYCNFLMDLDAFLIGLQDTVRYHKFGTTEKKIPGCDDACRRIGFYDQVDTKLAQLIERLYLTPAESMPRASLILTDGVQSTPDHENFKALIDAISGWLSRGFNFEVLMFRSDFFGEVYSEINKQVNKPYALPHSFNSDTCGKRPCYLYVLSPSEEFGYTVMGELNPSDDTNYIHYMNLGAELFESPEVTFEFLGEKYAGESSFLFNYDRSEESSLCYLYWEENGKPILQGFHRAMIRSRLKPKARSFIFTQKGIRCEAEAIDVESKEKIDSAPVALVDASVMRGSDLVQLNCDLRLQEVKPGRSVAYRIVLRPGSGTIQPPEWVRLASSRTDTSLMDFSKTLYLHELMNRLVRNSRLTEQPLAVFHIVVKGR